MVDHARAARLADRIKVIIATRLERGLRDPRLGFVTITDVRVTGDLQHATIFYTVYGTETEVADTAVALTAATGMLRSEVGKHLRVRLTPTLEFMHDALPENVNHIDRLLTEARARDEEAAQLARDADYAGDADPYVKPKDAADEITDGPTVGDGDGDAPTAHDAAGQSAEQ